MGSRRARQSVVLGNDVSTMNTGACLQILGQSRQTGMKNLQELLAQEMDTAWEQQKQAAKRLGEEAGTKLLLPLFLMLLVVMVLVMVPALMVML